MSLTITSNAINYNVPTVSGLASIVSPSIGDTVVVAEEGRGGVFIYRADGTSNDDTIFDSSSTGKWHRQYDVSLKANVTDMTNALGLKANITDMDSKAPIASPTFTGTPEAPTPTAGDNSTKIATTEFVNAEISNDVGVANSSLVKTALNASGSAPIYACRAWVNFNGTGTVAIRASGNVSSITDNDTGYYTVNFTTAMMDANYCVSGTTCHHSGVVGNGALSGLDGNLEGNCKIFISSTSGMYDPIYACVSIFR